MASLWKAPSPCGRKYYERSIQRESVYLLHYPKFCQFAPSHRHGPGSYHSKAIAMRSMSGPIRRTSSQVTIKVFATHVDDVF
jgi:hypothetical protein